MGMLNLICLLPSTQGPTTAWPSPGPCLWNSFITLASAYIVLKYVCSGGVECGGQSVVACGVGVEFYVSPPVPPPITHPC